MCKRFVSVFGVTCSKVVIKTWYHSSKIQNKTYLKYESEYLYS
jgi:hypothetical protein